MSEENKPPNRKKKRDRKPIKTFTDKFIDSLKPDSEMYQIRESQGFAIRVLPSGVKTWYYIYNIDGKRRQKNLGNYPDKSLKNARLDFESAREDLKKGIDPQASPQETTTVASEKDPELISVADLKKKFIEHKRTVLVDRSVGHHDKRLEKHIIPAWGNRPAREIRRSEAIRLIDEIAKNKRGAARNVILSGRALFEYALEREYVDINPFRKVGRAVPQAKAISRDRNLSTLEISTVWNGLSNGHGSSNIRRILKLVLLLGQRPGEVAEMRYEHINGDWWVIPKEETKIGKNPNIDPKKKFPPLAKELIGTGTSGFVFRTRNNTVIAEEKLPNFVKQEIIYKDGEIRKKSYYGVSEWIPHDLRRTMATRIAEDIGVSHEHIEAILGHIIPGVLGIYVRTRYDSKKQEISLAWEQRLLEIVEQQDENYLPSPAIATRRILTNDEIRDVWEGLTRLKSSDANRALKFILVSGQAPGVCASLHNEQILTDSTGKWWTVNSGIRIYLTAIAQQIIGNPEGYAFAPRKKSHINIATLSYHILKNKSFGLPKWTPDDLRFTAISKIRELGAPLGIVDALEHGAPTNHWELRHWLERWEELLVKIVS